jgi:hypothetical protein
MSYDEQRMQSIYEQPRPCEGPEGCDLDDFDSSKDKCKKCINEHNAYEYK